MVEKENQNLALCEFESIFGWKKGLINITEINESQFNSHTSFLHIRIFCCMISASAKAFPRNGAPQHSFFLWEGVRCVDLSLVKMESKKFGKFLVL